jgi:hypothetical protein
MNSSHKKSQMYIFYTLVFLIIFLSSLSPKILNNENIQNNDIIVLCVTSLIGTILVYILMLLYQKKKSKEKFHYELTPEKKCAGGSYMHQSNEECQKIWSTEEGLEKLSRFNCFNCIDGTNNKTGLYKGLPRNNTTLCEMSDGNWQNNCYSDDSDDFIKLPL